MPNRVASKDNMGAYRGKGVIGVMVSPIQYSYEQNTIRAYKSICYKVSFVKSNTKSISNSLTMQMVDATDEFLNNTTINGSQQPVSLADINAAHTLSENPSLMN